MPSGLGYNVTALRSSSILRLCSAADAGTMGPTVSLLSGGKGPKGCFTAAIGLSLDTVPFTALVVFLFAVGGFMCTNWFIV